MSNNVSATAQLMSHTLVHCSIFNMTLIGNIDVGNSKLKLPLDLTQDYIIINLTRLLVLIIIIGPDGIQSYNSSQLEIKPGYPFVLQWSVLGASAISRSHINLNGDTSSSSPGGITENLVPQCIQPNTSLSLVQPPIPQIVTWSISAANIEDAGEYRIMMGNFTSSVFVKGMCTCVCVCVGRIIMTCSFLLSLSPLSPFSSLSSSPSLPLSSTNTR